MCHGVMEWMVHKCWFKRLKVFGHISSWRFCENRRSLNQKFDACLTKIVYFPVHHRFRPFILIQMTVPFGPRPSTFISSKRSFLTWLDNKNLKALNDDQIASFGCQSGTFYQYSVRKVFWLVEIFYNRNECRWKLVQ